MKYLFLSLIFCSNWAFSQSDSLYAQDSKEIRTVIDQLFLGMKLGDSTMVGAQFSDDTRMYTTFYNSKGEMISMEESLQDFKKAVGTPHDQVWNEVISDVEIEIDDLLAQVWMNYSFYIDETFSHCGVNAAQLIKSQEGWKIVHLIDTRRKDNCH